MKILICIFTHGDERIGDFVENISFPDEVRVMIMNQRAMKENTRYVESDLNRSFNGKNNTLEEKLAQGLIPHIQQFDVVIDVHSTITGGTDAVITVEDTPEIREIASYMGASNYVFMPLMKTSVINQAKVGLALELGNDKDEERYLHALKNVVSFLLTGQGKKTVMRRYECTGSVAKVEGYDTPYGNYETITSMVAEGKNMTLETKEPFITFLWSNVQYKDIYGFSLKEIK
jgi:succinylglutamate desuccinylase